MPANGNIATLKNQIGNKAAVLRGLLDEAGRPEADNAFVSSRELDAAFIALDAVVAHAVNHLNRRWTAQG